MHFPLLSSAGERPVAAKGSPPPGDRGLRVKLLLGKEKSESGVAEAINSAGIMQLIICTKHLKTLMVMCCVQITPLSASAGYAHLS